MGQYHFCSNKQLMLNQYKAIVEKSKKKIIMPYFHRLVHLCSTRLESFCFGFPLGKVVDNTWYFFLLWYWSRFQAEPVLKGENTAADNWLHWAFSETNFVLLWQTATYQEARTPSLLYPLLFLCLCRLEDDVTAVSRSFAMTITNPAHDFKSAAEN